MNNPETTNAILQTLREIAQLTTQPSPWTFFVDDQTQRVLVLDANDLWVADCGIGPAEARHIAAFNPERCIALLDLIQTLQREAEHHRREICRLDVELARERREVRNLSAPAVPRQEW